MPRTPDPKKREKIIEFSIKSFCEKGFRDTSIKDIAELSGVAPGTVYTYFNDKKELYYEAINQIWNQFFQSLDKILNENSEVVEALNKGYELASNIIMMSYHLIKDMFTNKIRQKILTANLTKTANTVTRYLVKNHGNNSFFSEDYETLTCKIEIFLYGAFFQLAFSELDEFNQIREKQKKAFQSILHGEK
jgi:AcrR family transcriptional regulator